MVRFVLVRHGSAISDSPAASLTERGLAEARALASRLAEWRFDAAWSSDLPRAVQTAETLLAGREGPSQRRSEALREVERPQDLDPAFGPGYAAWEMETVPGLAVGLSHWLSAAVGAAEERSFGDGVPTILVVSHAGPLRVLICLLLGLPPESHWAFHLDRAGLTVVDRAGDLGTLILLNDCCHLRGNGSMPFPGPFRVPEGRE